MMFIESKFEEFINPGYFSRIDASHPLELFIGLDLDGRKSIELRAKYSYKKVTGTSSIEVNQYKKPEYNTLRFSLCHEEVSGLFYKFCEDLVEQTRDLKDKSEGYNSIINRFYLWKKLFVSSKKAFLSENEIMGLIGEILVIRDILIPELGSTKALKSWSGQELTHKDFSYDDTWIESKAVSKSAQTVKISSLEQLASENPGKLIVHRLEKMSTAYNGITLNKLILETKQTFDQYDEQDVFMSKVSLQGYEYNNYYDDFVYELVDCKKYTVNSDSPKITKSQVPSAIEKASYEISMSEISEFETV